MRMADTKSDASVNELIKIHSIRDVVENAWKCVLFGVSQYIGNGDMKRECFM